MPRVRCKSTVAQPDAWAALLAESLIAPGRPSADALTMGELGDKLGVTSNGARSWAKKQAAAGRVRILHGRSLTSNRPTIYVEPVIGGR